MPFLQVGQRACLQLAIALINAGAEAIVIEDMTASPDLLHPRTYKNTVAEYHRQLVQAVSVPAILHICGNVTLIAEEMMKSRAAALSIEPKAETPSMRTRVGAEMCLIGGIETISLSLLKSGEIKQMGLKALKSGIDILAPGCAIPPNSPTENLKAMVEAAEEYRRG